MKPLLFHIPEIWKRCHLPGEASHKAEYSHRGFCILFKGQKLSEQGFISWTFLSHPSCSLCAQLYHHRNPLLSSSELSVSEIGTWNFGGWIFGPGVFLGFDFCLHSNIPRADYSDPDHLRHLESKIPHQGFCLVLFINHIFRSRYPASKLSYLGKRNESRENARASGEAARGPSLARSREACFACPNRRACSQDKWTRRLLILDQSDIFRRWTRRLRCLSFSTFNSFLLAIHSNRRKEK